MYKRQKQDFEKGQPYAEMLDRYKDIACNYARMENAIAVLSDLRTNTSYISVSYTHLDVYKRQPYILGGSQ